MKHKKRVGKIMGWRIVKGKVKKVLWERTKPFAEIVMEAVVIIPIQ